MLLLGGIVGNGALSKCHGAAFAAKVRECYARGRAALPVNAPQLLVPQWNGGAFPARTGERERKSPLTINKEGLCNRFQVLK